MDVPGVSKQLAVPVIRVSFPLFSVSLSLLLDLSLGLEWKTCIWSLLFPFTKGIVSELGALDGQHDQMNGEF